jgi:hypothetical protein
MMEINACRALRSTKYRTESFRAARAIGVYKAVFKTGWLGALAIAVLAAIVFIIMLLILGVLLGIVLPFVPGTLA